MPFDPESFLQDESLEEIATSAPFMAKRISERSTGGVSKTESLLTGAAQGATFGFQPKLSAIVEKGIGAVTGNEAYKGVPISKLEEENKASVARAREANPGSFIAGDIVGGLSTTAPITALNVAKTGQLAAKLGRAGGAIARLTSAGAQGAGEASLRATAEGANLPKAAASGAALGAAGEAVGGLLKSIGKYGKNVAEEIAVKNIGFDAPALKRMRFKGDLLTNAKKVARSLMDEGVLNKPQTARQAHKAVSKVLEQTGEGLDVVYKEADKLAPNGLLNRNEILSIIENKLLDTDLPNIDKIAAFTEDVAKDLVSLPKDNKVGFARVWGVAKKLEKEANKFGRASDPISESHADLLTEAATGLRDFLKKAFAEVNPKLAETQGTLSNLYYNFSKAETALANKFLKSFSSNKALPRTGLYESIINNTIGSTPARGAAAGVTNLLSRSSNAAVPVVRGASQTLAEQRGSR